MSKKWTPLLAAVAALAAPGSAAAQSEWDYTATFYTWFLGISTTAETPVGDVESEIDFQEALEDLDFGLLGGFEARNGRVSLVSDLQYYDLGIPAEPPAGLGFTGGETDSKITVLSGYGMYALIDSDAVRFDVGAGLRHTDLSVETQLVGGGSTPDATFSGDTSVTDPLIAARLHRQFNDRWHGVAFADVGGFGIDGSSDLTWQAFAGVGYRFNKTWSAFGGYRNMTVEQSADNADFEVEVDVHGPFLGVQASF